LQQPNRSAAALRTVNVVHTQNQSGPQKHQASPRARRRAIACVWYRYNHPLRKRDKTAELITEKENWMPLPEPYIHTALGGVLLELAKMGLP